MSEWRYLGDGVYANFDGMHILLRVNSHENEESEIALEWQVFVALMGFAGKKFKVAIEVKDAEEKA